MSKIAKDGITLVNVEGVVRIMVTITDETKEDQEIIGHQIVRAISKIIHPQKQETDETNIE